MKGLSITGLVLAGVSPILLLLPLLLAPLGGEDFWQVDWAFFFFTVPVGYLLAIAGAVLVIVAAGIALSRGFRPKAIAVVGIVLAGTGLLVEPVGVLGFIAGWGEWLSAVLLGLGILLGLTGVVMCAISGLRGSGFRGYRRVR